MNAKKYEYPLNKNCPCGSNKKYKNCCKNKNLQWLCGEDKVFQSIEINDELLEIIKYQKDLCKEMYNRDVQDDDRVLFDNFFCEEQHNIGIFKILKESDIPDEYIYAYFKTGLFVCQQNINNIPDIEIQNFNYYIKEYKELINSEIGDSINILKFVDNTNEILHKTFVDTLRYLQSTINDYMSRHFDSKKFLNYNISSEKDYFGFSMYKLYKDLDTIKFLEDNNQTESIYAIGRGIFENYLYVCAINKDKNIFKKKILPKTMNSKYTFCKRADGTINYNKVIDNETLEKINIQILTADLTKYSTNKYDNEIYHLFYKKACQYIHMDVLTARSYFTMLDPFTSVNQSYIAGIIVLSIATFLLKEISESDFTQKQYKKDLNFLYKKLTKDIGACFELLMCDKEDNNLIYSVLLNRLDIIKES